MRVPNTIVVIAALAALTWSCGSCPPPPPPPLPPTTPSNLAVSGDRAGKVTVTEASTGAVVKTFQMDARPVRETYVLGRDSVAAAQLHQSKIWTVSTGAVAATLDHRIQAFTADRKRYLGAKVLAGAVELGIYSYPGSTKTWTLSATDGAGAPAVARFSPDGRYIVVQLSLAYPIPDDRYPTPPELRVHAYRVLLFDIEAKTRVEQFFGPADDDHTLGIVGDFSSDSRLYTVGGNGSPIQRFNLQTKTWR